MLKEKVAIITGAGSGIGRGTALVFAEYGAKTVAVDLNLSAAAETANQCVSKGGFCEAIQLDVTNNNEIESVFANVASKYGRIDILVNAAGIAIQNPVSKATEAEWDKTMDINLKAIFLTCKAALQYMVAEKYGKIVNVSSRSAKIGEENNAAYCASKAAVNMLTQVLALETARLGVNVNAICPSMVDTEMIRGAILRFSEEKKVDPEEFAKSWVSEIPMNRMASPEEVGEFIAFLCSEKSQFLTGSSYNIDGGFIRI
jgi:NAD(P)-dependent dehydrogenase (short-subunit alcohol dehydrogenase family)